ncbi:MAG: hypothetical protein ACXAEU_26360 [Candidatus Hodarchaeales archaeon]|jgi:hypothetical protein
MTSNQDFKWNREKITQYLLTVDSGNEHFRFGKTRVNIYGTGGFEIENLTGIKRTPFSGTLGSQELEEIFSEAVLGTIWYLKYNYRPGIPDEAKINLNLFEDGKEVAKLELWVGVMKEHPQSARLVQVLQGLVEKYTKGQFIL